MDNFIDSKGFEWNINHKKRMIERADKEYRAGIRENGCNYFGTKHGNGFWYQHNFEWCALERGEMFKKVNELFN